MAVLIVSILLLRGIHYLAKAWLGPYASPGRYPGREGGVDFLPGYPGTRVRRRTTVFARSRTNEGYPGSKNCVPSYLRCPDTPPRRLG
eukprot:3848226-Rhodomonas_salina.1